MTPAEAREQYSEHIYEVRQCADCPNAVVRRVPGSGWFHAAEVDGDECPGFGKVKPA